jgi:hypothetical protein
MKSSATADEVTRSIAQVERRIELRRARMARHTEEIIETAERKAKPIALAAVGAVAVAGFILGRGPSKPVVRRTAGVAAKTGVAAALVTALQAALRIGTNPLVRSAWNSYRRKRVRQP